MQYQPLGKSVVVVSRLGFGCMGLSEGFGPVRDCPRDALRRAVDAGITLFDTADIYGFGENERLLGSELSDIRHRLVFATKCGIVRTDSGKRLDGSPAYVRRACDASLRRLQTDYLDVFYLHRPDPATPIEESVGAMAELVRHGKVRAIGLSKVDAALLGRAETVHPIAAVQMNYSLFRRKVETTLIDDCRRRHVALVAYSPLSKGLLSSDIRSFDSLTDGDFRRHDPRFQPEALSQIQEQVRILSDLAISMRRTPAQLALAWLLSRAPYVVPIPGMRSTHHVDEDVEALDIRITETGRQVLDGLESMLAAQ